MNTTQTTTCTNCGETLVRSLAVPVWGHVTTMFAGSTLCEDGRKASPAN